MVVLDFSFLFDMAHAFPAFQSFALLSAYCIEERKLFRITNIVKGKVVNVYLSDLTLLTTVFIGNVYEDDANYK